MRSDLSYSTLVRWFRGSALGLRFKTRTAGAYIEGVTTDRKFSLSVKGIRGNTYRKMFHVDDERLDFSLFKFGMFNLNKNVVMVTRRPLVQYRDGLSNGNSTMTPMFGSQLYYGFYHLDTIESLVNPKYFHPEVAYNFVTDGKWPNGCAINNRWSVAPLQVRNKVRVAMYQYSSPVGLFNGRKLLTFSDKALPLKEEVEELGIQFDVRT